MTKKCGVPLACMSSPRSASASMILLVLVGLHRLANLLEVEPERRWRPSRGPRPRASAAKRRACRVTSQNPLSPFSARASRATSAAGSARGWNGSGSFFQTKRTLSPYLSWICLSVGSTRLQYGHWKSENSTMVTWARLLLPLGSANSADREPCNTVVVSSCLSVVVLTLGRRRSVLFVLLRHRRRRRGPSAVPVATLA